MDYDPATKLPMRHGLDVYGGVVRTELTAPQTLRVHLARDIPVPVGHLVVLRHYVYGHNAIAFHRCADVTVEDVEAFIPEATRMGVYVTLCDEAGRYEVKGLPNDTYTLIALTKSGANEGDISQWRWLTLQVALDENNKELSLDFDLR